MQMVAVKVKALRLQKRTKNEKPRDFTTLVMQPEYIFVDKLDKLDPTNEYLNLDDIIYFGLDVSEQL